MLTARGRAANCEHQHGGCAAWRGAAGVMYGLRAQWLHGVWLRGVCVRERASGVAHSLLDGGAESLVLLFPVDEQPRHELRGDGAQSSEAHDLDAGKRCRSCLHACGNRARPADENKQKYFAASFQRQKIPRVLHPFRLAVRHLRKACPSGCLLKRAARARARIRRPVRTGHQLAAHVWRRP